MPVNITLPADGDPNWGPTLRAAINAINANVGTAALYVGGTVTPTGSARFLWFKDVSNGIAEMWIEDGE